MTGRATPKLIPVVDVKEGIAVGAVAGERSKYEALTSRLTESTDPSDVVAALRSTYRCDTCYVADLDAIGGRISAREAAVRYRHLIDDGPVWLDAGIATAEQAAEVTDCGLDAVIGLETLECWSQLPRMAAAATASRLIFSLDLHEGQPLGIGARTEPLQIVERVVTAGIGRLVVLDLARVGTGRGVSTLPLCRHIAAASPHLELITGGGIASRAEYIACCGEPLYGVLVASVLHDGRWQGAGVTR